MRRNPYLAQLSDSYLFTRVEARRREFLTKNPGADLVRLGVGDTTLPLPGGVARAAAQYAEMLGTKEGYSGYGPTLGWSTLRQAIAAKLYSGIVDGDEITLSDGAKSDIARFATLIGPGRRVAIQDPSYPVYLDLSCIMGHTIHLLPCTKENDFFPDLKRVPPVDVVYFCSPNNPTGQAASRSQLRELVTWAKKSRALILFDAAYAPFIQDPSLPKSIFEIEGAREVAIEVGSFSKLAGFTGARLGWTVVPKELKFDDGSAVGRDFARVLNTTFNGPSTIAQAAGLAALEDRNWSEVQSTVRYYLENAKLIREALFPCESLVFGGKHAPYIWLQLPGKTSWEGFDWLLEKFQLLTVPGVGFGASADGFVRLTSFGSRTEIEEASHRLRSVAEHIGQSCLV